MEYTLKELEEWNVKIEKKAKEFGLDYYPQEFEIIGFNEMLAYEAYVGMPSKYPHWSYGKLACSFQADSPYTYASHISVST